LLSHLIPSSTIGLYRQRLHIPDHLSILIDTAVAREEAHPTDSRDALGQPPVLILVRLVDELVRLDVAVKVVRHEIVVAVLDDAVDERRELAGVAKGAGADGFEDAC